MRNLNSRLKTTLWIVRSPFERKLWKKTKHHWIIPLVNLLFVHEEIIFYNQYLTVISLEFIFFVLRVNNLLSFNHLTFFGDEERYLSSMLLTTMCSFGYLHVTYKFILLVLISILLVKDIVLKEIASRYFNSRNLERSAQTNNQCWRSQNFRWKKKNNK